MTDKLTVQTVTSSSAIRHSGESLAQHLVCGRRHGTRRHLLFGLPGRRRAWQRMLSLMLLVVAVGMVGCGGSSSGGAEEAGRRSSTPSGSYTVTVTATSGTTTQTSTVKVTVQ